MDLQTLILLALQGSVFLMVFALGLQARPEDALYLFKRPGQFARSLLSMIVIMPIVALALWYAFDFPDAVKIALITLSVSPVPPILPKKGLKAGGRESYTIGLLVGLALISVITVPLAVKLVGFVMGRQTSMDFLQVAKIVTQTILVPLGGGIAVHRFFTSLADKIAKPITLISTIALVVGLVVILYVAMPAISSLTGSGGILAISIFVVIGLGVGHLLGGPDPDDRTVLAIATATRHPGVALAVASANSPHNKLVLAAILLALVVNMVVTIPYVSWRKRRHTIAASPSV